MKTGVRVLIIVPSAIFLAIGFLAYFAGVTDGFDSDLAVGILFFVGIGGIGMYFGTRDSKPTELRKEEPGTAVPVRTEKIPAQSVPASEPVRQIVCKSCGASIKVGPDTDECEYCGTFINKYQSIIDQYNT
ncbi:MAG: hypothetical protein ACM3PE_09270 [Deltaproteobacteria bacterium]